MALRSVAMEPASRIISALGGPAAVAAEVGVHRVTVSKWKMPRSAGGTGGIIPIQHVRPLIGMAKRVGIDLTANDFLPENEEDAA